MTSLKPAAGGTPLFYPRTVKDRCGFSLRGDLQDLNESWKFSERMFDGEFLGYRDGR